jgi:hypothetical protein
MYRKLNKQDRRDDEFWEVAISSNMRNTAEYRVAAKCADDLANVNVEIGVFKKTSLII